MRFFRCARRGEDLASRGLCDRPYEVEGDVGAELDLAPPWVEYEGLRTTTATSCTFGLLNRVHTDKMDEQDTEVLSWVESSPSTSRPSSTASYRRSRAAAAAARKHQERGTAPYQFQLGEFVPVEVRLG